MPRPVLLFKESSPDNSYEDILQEMGYIAKCVPVLETRTTNIEVLVDYLLNAEELGLCGFIITSKRSCDSLAEALAELCQMPSEAYSPALGWSYHGLTIHAE